MKLFAVCVGGNHPRANVELHDIRFAVGETLESIVPQLRAMWWGEPRSLHIDGYAELTEADGWRVELVRGPAPEGRTRTLWFVNVGGYSPALFGEQHHYFFLAGEAKAEVWTRARSLSPEWLGRHKDNFISVDEILDVNGLLDGGWHVRLEQAATGAAPMKLVSDYIRL